MNKLLKSLFALTLVVLAGCDDNVTNNYYNTPPGGSASGTITVAVAPSVPAQNIAVNTALQVLGGYETNVNATESITESAHTFHAHTTSGSLGSGKITNAYLYDENNLVVAGPVDATIVASGQDITFADTVTYPAGVHSWKVQGKLPATASNDTVVEISTNARLDWGTAHGKQTGAEYSLPNTLVTMSPMTVKVPALSIAVGSLPAPQTVIAGASGVSFMTILLDATNSGEDIHLPSLPIAKMFSESVYSYLSGCQVLDGAMSLNTGSNIFNPQIAEEEMVTFDSILTVTKGTIRSVLLKCNISANASGTFNFAISPTGGAVVATGALSGGAATITGVDGMSATMTVGGSNLTISTSPSSQSYQLAAGDAVGVTQGVARICAFNEDITSDKLGIAVLGASNVSQVSISTGSTVLGSIPITSSTSTSVVTLTNPLTITKDTCVDVTPKADLQKVGTGQAGLDGMFVKIDITSVGTHAVGVTSGSTITPIGSTNVSGMRVFKSYPMIAAVAIPSTNASDGHLMQIKTTASSKGDTGFAKWTFKVVMKDAAGVVIPLGVTNVNLYGYSDASCSVPLTGMSGGQIAFPAVAPDANGLVRIRPPGVITVPAGMTYCFDLRSSVVAMATSYTITTTLMNDSSAATFTQNVGTGCATGATNSVPYGELCPVGTNSRMGTVADLEAIESMLIWSPNGGQNPITSSYMTSVDWANGYGVYGLPVSGITQVVTR